MWNKEMARLLPNDKLVTQVNVKKETQGINKRQKNNNYVNYN